MINMIQTSPSNSQLRRGDVVIVDFTPTDGCGSLGRRPAVVVQNDTGNRFSRSIIVVPITSRQKKRLPTHYEFRYGDVLNFDWKVSDVCGTVLCEDIITVDRSRLGDAIGHVIPTAMNCIDIALRVSLGLGGTPHDQ